MIQFDSIITAQSHVAHEVLRLCFGAQKIRKGWQFKQNNAVMRNPREAQSFKTRLALEHVFRKDTSTLSCFKASRLNKKRDYGVICRSSNTMVKTSVLFNYFKIQQWGGVFASVSETFATAAKKEWEGHKYNMTNLAERSERISTWGI